MDQSKKKPRGKYNASVGTSKYRSSLEQYAAKRLEEEGIAFSYEGVALELLPPFESKFECYARVGKKFKKISPKVRNMVYNPDFVGEGWIMETKGMKTADFLIKWKMFRYFMRYTNYLILLPSNKKEVEECITLINERKQLLQN